MRSHVPTPDRSPTVQVNIKNLIDEVQCYSPFAPSISNCLNFKLLVESSIQSQPLQDVLL